MESLTDDSWLSSDDIPKYNDDSGALSGSGYLISAGDMENGWMADFTAIGLQVYFNSLVNHAAVTELEDGETQIDDYIGYAYTSYGLHIIMVCFDPLQNLTVDNSISNDFPVGVSEYQLSNLIPEKYKSSLPTIDELEESESK